MSTVLDIITASLLDLGAIASGEAPTAAEATDALRALNLLLESWRLESLMVYAMDTITFQLTGAANYTWGIGGTINAPRPVRLERAAQRIAGSGSGLDIPLRVLTDTEYESLMLKGLISTLAQCIYLDHAYPLASVFLWPIPGAGDTILLYPWHPLLSFQGLTTTVSLPPGYERALQKALAIELAPAYRDAQATPVLLAQAMDSKALIKSLNVGPRFLRLPSSLRMGGRRGFLDRATFLGGDF